MLMAIYRDELLFLENMELDMMKIYIFSLKNKASLDRVH